MDLSEQKNLEQEQKITKLSLAIRIGALFRGQCKNEYFGNGGSCALGAAWEAMRMKGYPPMGVDEAVKEMGFQVPFFTAVEIAIKNDEGWTRERIADWLEWQGY